MCYTIRRQGVLQRSGDVFLTGHFREAARTPFAVKDLAQFNPRGVRACNDAAITRRPIISRRSRSRGDEASLTIRAFVGGGQASKFIRFQLAYMFYSVVESQHDDNSDLAPATLRPRRRGEVLGLLRAQTTTGRSDSSRHRRAGLARRAAHRRWQVAVLPGPAVDLRSDRRCRLTADRVDEGPGRRAAGLRLPGCGALQRH